MKLSNEERRVATQLFNKALNFFEAGHMAIAQDNLDACLFMLAQLGLHPQPKANRKQSTKHH